MLRARDRPLCVYLSITRISSMFAYVHTVHMLDRHTHTWLRNITSHHITRHEVTWHDMAWQIQYGFAYITLYRTYIRYITYDVRICMCIYTCIYVYYSYYIGMYILVDLCYSLTFHSCLRLVEVRILAHSSSLAIIWSPWMLLQGFTKVEHESQAMTPWGWGVD